MSVSIPKIAKNGKYLKIRFNFRGVRYMLSDGYPDTRAGRKRAEATVESIRADIYAENLDTTLDGVQSSQKGRLKGQSPAIKVCARCVERLPGT
ncbi:MAG: DUF3596 domain-containing protein [Cyanobacteria bacterium P01_H01_bin.152]